MSSGLNDPRMLYSINNIRAYHIQNGEESDLTPSGPQTLSLLMVPTSNATSSSTDLSGTPPEEDFYLHLHLPPELDLPLPATTQIYHQPPTSYLIPRWDIGPDSGAFTRIQFPAIGSGPDKVTQEDVDTFETILAQCTAFLERAGPPKGQNAYNPADFAPGEAYVGTGSEKPGQKTQQPQHPGQIVIVDEENGSVVGELTEGYNVVETGVKPGSKIPVEIQLPAEGNEISVTSASEEYLQLTKHPAYKNSTIVQTSATASRLIVTGSSYVANALQSGADAFTKKTKPNPKPMTFAPATHERIRKINTFSTSAAGLSSKTVGQVSKYAQNFGASLTRRGERGEKFKGYDKNGQPIPNYKPGVLNKSMIAFSTVADGIEHGARNLLYSGSAAAGTVVGHRYGAEAGHVATNLAGGAKNVGLVYIDAAGVSRKAVVKSVAKGMVVGQMRDGKQLIVGSGDGGQLPSDPSNQSATPPEKASGLGQSTSSHSLSGMNPSIRRGPSPAPTPPPAYGAQTGRTLSGTPPQTEKR
ncbi:hypothetical protein FQN54_000208 [Arachnomyces sp. PD_36]|nr:hypothetical protein FQN54_000208 [Arachnomyces sp. PD_36]